MDTGSPTISIVVPTKDRPDLLIRALESALRQSFSDTEILVVDDGSNAENQTRMKEFFATDPRIRVQWNPESLGAAGARNLGAKLARGTWLAYLDDDDTWHPTKIERQLAAARDLDAVACTCGHWFKKYGFNLKKIIPPQPITVESILEGSHMGGGTVLFVRRDIFLEIGGMDKAFVPIEDLDFWIRLRMRGPVAAVYEVLADYYAHSGARISKRHGALYLGQRKMLSQYAERITPKARQRILSNACMHRGLDNINRRKPAIIWFRRALKVKPTLRRFLDIVYFGARAYRNRKRV